VTPAADADAVEKALHAAVDALVERAEFFERVLSDPDVHGMNNLGSLRDRISSDESAAVVLRALLDRGSELTVI
jgi:hypothetical protein